MTYAEYKDVEGLNYSAAQWLLRSPAHFLAYLEKPEDEEKFSVERLTHQVILENTCLEELVAIKPPGMNFATKEGKAWRSSQALTTISEADARDVVGMSQAVGRHEQAMDFLLACPDREVLIRSTYRGVKTKGRPDAVGQTDICDLKCVRDARDIAFARQVEQYNWDLQAVFYQVTATDRDAPEHSFHWITVENTPPYAVKVWHLEYEMQVRGLQKLKSVFDLYLKCLEKDNWAARMHVDYADETQGLVPAPWILKQLEGAGML